MRSVLVTGGTGFLGSRLVRMFAEGGFAVRCAGHAAKESSGSRSFRRGRLEYVELDVRNLAPLVDAVSGRDLVIHTVALTESGSPEERRRQEEVNVDGTRNVLEACRRTRASKLLYVSSTAAVGISLDPSRPADEGFEFNLGEIELIYPRTKHRAEKLVLEANGEELETVVVNPGYMFGRFSDGYRGSEVIDRVLETRRFLPYTGGGMSIVHVEDVVEGIRRVIDSGRSGERFILSGDNVTFREVARTVCRVAGLRRTLVPIPDPIRDLAGFVLDSILEGGTASFHPHLHREFAYRFYSSRKARQDLNYRPRSFRDIVVDYLQHRGLIERAERSGEGEPPGRSSDRMDGVLT